MEKIQINLLLKCASCLAALMVFLLLQLLGKDKDRHVRLLRAYREMEGLITAGSRETGYYRKNKRWLEKKGAAFHFGKWVDPIRFLVFRLILGLTGLWIGLKWGAGYGLPAFLLLFFLPAWLVYYLNKRDNERLLPELKLMYHALEIQIKAGIYMTDALAECYGSVQDRRLRQALLELAGDIVMKADIYESLEKFQGKFDNRYVDSLCITIFQALESGQAVELLRDIGEQIKDMEETVLERKKAALDRRITFCQLGVLTVVLGLALYACVSYMFGAVTLF